MNGWAVWVGWVSHGGRWSPHAVGLDRERVRRDTHAHACNTNAGEMTVQRYYTRGSAKPKKRKS